MDGSAPAGFSSRSSPGGQKSTTTAGFCSSVLPGLGQVYNGETAKGFVFFLLTLAGLVFFVVPGLIVWLYAMYDAYSVAGKMNTGEILFKETRTLHMILFIVFAVVVIIFAILIVIAMISSVIVSMTDSLNAGDINRIV